MGTGSRDLSCYDAVEISDESVMSYGDGYAMLLMSGSYLRRGSLSLPHN